MEKYDSIESAAQAHAACVAKCNLLRKNSEGLIATAVIYGAHEVWGDLQELTFGQAVQALKAGKKVARKGWNGKGMFLWLKPAATVKAEWCKDPMLKNLAEANGGEIEALGTICMFTAQKQILSGWLASQTDILSEDWIVVSE